LLFLKALQGCGNIEYPIRGQVVDGAGSIRRQQRVPVPAVRRRWEGIHHHVIVAFNPRSRD
jgi:hypothetical protein